MAKMILKFSIKILAHIFPAKLLLSIPKHINEIRCRYATLRTAMSSHITIRNVLA